MTGHRCYPLARSTGRLGSIRYESTCNTHKKHFWRVSESLRQDLGKLTYDKRPNESVFGLNYRSLGMKIKEWSDKAGVPLHTHSFRHYFATKLVEKGANIRVVQELLGHSSLNTTQVYLLVTANHLEEAIGLLDE